MLDARSLAEIEDALPRFLPAKEKHRAIVSAPNKSGNGAVTSTNVHMNGAIGMGGDEAVREFLANFIDQVGRSNGPGGKRANLNGLFICRGTRGTDRVLLLHNGRQRLGEIIHSPEPHLSPKQYFAQRNARAEKIAFGTLTFINYGAIVPSLQELMSFCATKKRDIDNQVGRHGEGLKFAMATLLRLGVGIVLEFPLLNAKGYPELKRMRAFLENGGEYKKVVYTKLTKLESHDHHFAVTLTYPKEGYTDIFGNDIAVPIQGVSNFDMFYYMVPFPLIRSRLDAADCGTILFNASDDGRLYIWNFFICEDHDMNWGYNLFIAATRSRDQVDPRIRDPAIANVWSRYLEEHPATDEHAQAFALLVCFAPWSHLVEQSCIRLLSPGACQKVRAIFGVLFPGAVAVIGRETEAAAQRFWAPFHALPDHCQPLIAFTDDVLIPFYVRETRAVAVMQAAPVCVSMTEQLAMLAPGLVMVDAPLCPFIYVASRDNQTLYLNWAYYATKSGLDQIVNHVAFRVLPVTQRDTLPLAKNLIKRERQPEPESESEADDEFPPAVPGYKWIRTEYSLVPE